MEGKELYNDDEELDPKSKKEESEEDFGLPEIENNQDSDPDGTADIGDPFAEDWEEEKPVAEFSTEENTDVFESSTSEDNSYDNGMEHLAAEEEDHDQDFHSSYYEEEYNQKKSPVGWIILAVFVVIAIIVGIFWWMNREEPKPIVVEKQKPVEQPVQKAEPEPEVIKSEPEPAPEPVKAAGVYEINEPTGRYYVIVASSIDKDLVHDYATKLSKKGMSCSILAPRGKKKFHRLAVADFVSLNDAALKAEQLKGEMGDEVWVIRY